MILKQKYSYWYKVDGKHVGFDSGFMKHCMPKCQDHISDKG